MLNLGELSVWAKKQNRRTSRVLLLELLGERVVFDGEGLAIEQQILAVEQQVIKGGVAMDDYYPETPSIVPITTSINIVDQIFDYASNLFGEKANTRPFVGTSGPDELIGNPNNNRLVGLNGNDSLSEMGGHGTLLGNRGDDQLYDGPGWDESVGGKGSDTHYDGPGNDVHRGGLGIDKYRFAMNASHNEIVDLDTSGQLVFPGRVAASIYFVRIGDDLEIRLGTRQSPDHSVRFREYFSFNRSGWTLESDDGVVQLDSLLQTSKLVKAKLAIDSYNDVVTYVPAGWNLVSRVRATQSGLEANLFQTDKPGQFELVIRGTELNQFGDDHSLRFGGLPQALDLIPRIDSWISAHSIRHLGITGHSQGYQVATWATVVQGRQYPHVFFEVVGFNGLGLRDLLPAKLTSPLPNASFENVVHEGDFATPLAGRFLAGTKFCVIPMTEEPTYFFSNHPVESGILQHLESQFLLPAWNLESELGTLFQEQRDRAGLLTTYLNPASIRQRILDEYASDWEELRDEARYRTPMMTKGGSAEKLEFDFGTNDSPLAVGAIRATKNSLYSVAQGWGLEGAEAGQDRGRDTNLLRDVVLGEDLTFLADLNPGTYDVTVHIGDRESRRDRVAVALGGYIAEEVTTAPGELISRTYRVHLVERQFELRIKDLGGQSERAALAGLTIERVDPSVRPVINVSRASDPVIIVLTPGKDRGTIWDNAIDAIELIPELVKLGQTIAKGVAHFKAQQWHALLKDLWSAYKQVRHLHEEFKSIMATEMPQWMSVVAAGLNRENRLLGYGPLDMRIQPVDPSLLTGHDLTSQWKGSKNFVMLDNRTMVDRPHEVGRRIASLLTEHIVEARTEDPSLKFDLLFIGHDNGIVANRTAIEMLDLSTAARSIDFVKAVLLSPVAADADAYYWIRPDQVKILDSVASYTQNRSLALGGNDEDNLIWGKPIDKRPLGGWTGFFNGIVRLFSVSNGQELSQWRHLEINGVDEKAARLTDVAYSPDGKYVVTSGRDKTVQIKQIASSEAPRQLPQNSDVLSIEVTNRFAFLLLANSKIVSLDLLTGSQVASVDVPNARSFSMDAQGTQLYTGHEGGAVTWWTISTSGTISLNRRHSLHQSPVGEIAVHAQQLIATAARDGSLIRFSTIDLPAHASIQVNAPVRDLQFMGNGDLLVAAGKKILQLRKSASGDWGILRELTHHVDAVRSLTVSSDGKTLVSAGDDKTIFVLDLISGQITRVINKPMQPIRKLLISPTGESIVTISQNNLNGAVSDRDITDLVSERLPTIDQLFGTTKFHEAVPYVYADYILANLDEGFLIYRDSDRSESRRNGFIRTGRSESGDLPSDKPLVDPTGSVADMGHSLSSDGTNVHEESDRQAPKAGEQNEVPAAIVSQRKADQSSRSTMSIKHNLHSLIQAPEPDRQQAWQTGDALDQHRNRLRRFGRY